MVDVVEPVRLADLTVALSLATDLGTGQPLEHGLQTCKLALATAERLGLTASVRSDVYYVALLRFIGCTSDASETATLVGGDDVAFNAVMAPMLMAGPAEGLRHVVRHLAEGLPARRRATLVARALADPGGTRRSLSQHCEVASRLASRLGLGGDVTNGLAHAYERWDGKGHPNGLAGEEVPVAVRVVTVARDAELWARAAGWPAAVDVLRGRRGHAYDPAVVDAVLDGGDHDLTERADDAVEAILAAEPVPVASLDRTAYDAALTAFADFADLKSVWLRGHSTGVAALVGDAARAAGLPDSIGAGVRRAALVHDVGRVGVPSGTWDRCGPLLAQQWEQVRLHPYFTERILSRCPGLTPLAEVAAHHHERADGSGYHRGASADRLDAASRLLAAADAYHAMTEERPHRSALSSQAAATELAKEVERGRFGPAEVEAVLSAAGHARRTVAIARPAGLTTREVEVLGLIARGHPNKQVASLLGISAKTVGRHIENIYAKTGVTTRAGAALFAMEHGLLPPARP